MNYWSQPIKNDRLVNKPPLAITNPKENQLIVDCLTKKEPCPVDLLSVVENIALGAGFSLSAGSRPKKPDTWRLEPSTFGENMVSRGSENLKLPKKHNWQAVYFNILAVNCKT